MLQIVSAMCANLTIDSISFAPVCVSFAVCVTQVSLPSPEMTMPASPVLEMGAQRLTIRVLSVATR